MTDIARLIGKRLTEHDCQALNDALAPIYNAIAERWEFADTERGAVMSSALWKAEEALEQARKCLERAIAELGRAEP